jgi:hypothetical protein
MKSRPRRSTIVALAAVALLAFPAVASGAIDYSKNAANGEYAPADSPSVRVVTVADNGGFAWGDAAIGAGVTLALALIALRATTVVRRRRIASPST